MTISEIGADPLPEGPHGVSGPASSTKAWSLAPRQRKSVLTAHILLSVGLLGIYAAMLALATVALATNEPGTSGAAYRSMGILTGLIPPAAVGTLATGVLLALGTGWGLFKHTWVVAKLALAAVTVLVSILVVSPAIRQATAATARAPLTAADPGSASQLLMVASAAIVLMLSTATAIAVYKPWGAIPRRRRASARSAA